MVWVESDARANVAGVLGRVTRGVVAVQSVGRRLSGADVSVSAQSCGRSGAGRACFCDDAILAKAAGFRGKKLGGQLSIFSAAIS